MFPATGVTQTGRWCPMCTQIRPRRQREREAECLNCDTGRKEGGAAVGEGWWRAVKGEINQVKAICGNACCSVIKNPVTQRLVWAVSRHRLTAGQTGILIFSPPSHSPATDTFSNNDPANSNNSHQSSIQPAMLASVPLPLSHKQNPNPSYTWHENSELIHLVFSATSGFFVIRLI